MSLQGLDCFFVFRVSVLESRPNTQITEFLCFRSVPEQFTFPSPEFYDASQTYQVSDCVDVAYATGANARPWKGLRIAVFAIMVFSSLRSY